MKATYTKYAEKRDRKNVKDSEVASECNIGKSTFTDWKNKRSAPKYDKLCKIAKFLECTVDDFIEENDISETSETVRININGFKNCITEPYAIDILNVLSGIRDELHAIRECIENEKR